MSTSAFTLEHQRIDPALFDEAAEFLIQLQSGGDAEAINKTIAQWRQRSAMHERAWQCAENVLSSFRQVPGAVGRRTLDNLRRSERRRLLQTLGIVAFGGPLALAVWKEQPWAEWSADLRTATGEQKTFMLADGTRLALNTATAVNIAFSEKERHVHLVRGEIMVTTGQDAAQRAFRVSSAEGDIRPIGTRYSVRQEHGQTQVAVFEGAVEIATQGGQTQSLQAGERVTFGNAYISLLRPLDANAGLWEQGMLLARDMRLADWVKEMERYRPGILRCSPAAAELRISGAFPLTDSDAALEMLARTLPIVVHRTTRYWVSLDLRA